MGIETLNESLTVWYLFGDRQLLSFRAILPRLPSKSLISMQKSTFSQNSYLDWRGDLDG